MSKPTAAAETTVQVWSTFEHEVDLNSTAYEGSSLSEDLLLASSTYHRPRVASKAHGGASANAQGGAAAQARGAVKVSNDKSNGKQFKIHFNQALTL